MGGGTLQEQIAARVCDLSFHQLPREVVDTAKVVLIHDLAVAVAGSRAPESRRAVAFARGAAGRPGQCRIVGTGDQAAPLDAAFANAVIMRALRQEDSILPSFIHPGPVVIPVALAIGEEVGATGAEFLTAMVAGYEVAGKLAGSDWTWVANRRTPSHVFGAFGAAVAAAKLLGCDQVQTMTAIAYAGNLAAMITHGFDNHQYGVVAHNGMRAAYLGQAGAPAPADALEGPYGFFASQMNGVPGDLDTRFANWGMDFEILTSVLKPHPCTAINLVPILLLERMLSEHTIPRETVERLTVHRSRDSDGIPWVNSPGPWSESAHVISSLAFSLGAVLLDGSVLPEHFLDPGNPDVVERSKRVRIDMLPTTDLFHHVLELQTADGRTFTAQAGAEILPTPDPMKVLGDDGIAVIGRGKAAELPQVIATLENLASVRELTRLLIP